MPFKFAGGYRLAGSGLSGVGSWTPFAGATLDLDFVNDKYLAPIPNRVTNGTFDTDISGWTTYGVNGGSAAGVVWDSGGRLNVTGNGTGQSGAYQTFATAVGATYEVSLNITNQGANVVVSTAPLTGANTIIYNQILGPSASLYTVRFIATTTSTTITFWRTTASAAYVDNVSIKEVNPPMERLLTVSSPSPGYAQGRDGAWNFFPANQARHTNRGLLIEEIRTNSIPRNDWGGTTIGGSSVNGWGQGGGASTREVLEIKTIQGIPCAIVKYTGTTFAGNLYHDTSSLNVIAAVAGETWTGSHFMQIISSDVPLLPPSITVYAMNAAVGQVGVQTVTAPSADFQRVSTSYLMPTNTAWVFLRLNMVRFNGAAGVPFTVVVAHGLAQLEKGTFVTSPIACAGTATTRQADIITLLTGPWFNAATGTLYAEGGPDYNGSANTALSAALASLDDTTTNNRIMLRRGNAANTADVSHLTAGVNVLPTQGIGAVNSWLTGSHKVAEAWAANDFQGCYDGTLGTPSASGAVASVTTLRVGNALGASGPLNGYLKRLAYNPSRLSNAALQARCAA